MNDSIRASRLRGVVRKALLDPDLSTYVDEDQDVIDGLLSEVVDTVAEAVADAIDHEEV